MKKLFLYLLAGMSLVAPAADFVEPNYNKHAVSDNDTAIMASSAAPTKWKVIVAYNAAALEDATLDTDYQKYKAKMSELLLQYKVSEIDLNTFIPIHARRRKECRNAVIMKGAYTDYKDSVGFVSVYIGMDHYEFLSTIATPSDILTLTYNNLNYYSKDYVGCAKILPWLKQYQFSLSESELKLFVKKYYRIVYQNIGVNDNWKNLAANVQVFMKSLD